MIKQSVSQLLEAEMDRKDFLKLVAFGAVAATGVTQVLKAVSQQAPQRGITTSTSGAGKTPVSLAYGNSPYGGHPKTASL